VSEKVWVVTGVVDWSGRRAVILRSESEGEEVIGVKVNFWLIKVTKVNSDSGFHAGASAVVCQSTEYSTRRLQFGT
jgi:hypothetical protein